MPIFPLRRHPLETVAMIAAKMYVQNHLVENVGMNDHDAAQAVSSAASGGLGNFMTWLLANLPTIYAVVEAILSIFGIHLPPLPPIPIPVPPPVPPLP